MRIVSNKIHADALIPGMVSIILLTRNGLRFTKQCVESIKRYTRMKFELVFVDNGSTDGTVEYLKRVKGAKLILNRENKGFAGGCNQGLLAARGEFIVFLNNDTVVTKDWLPRMLRCLKKDKSAGIVGARSNRVLIGQKVIKVPYKTMKEMHKFAARWAKVRKGRRYELDRLSGFCMLFHRSLVKEIGGLDERFYPGNAEDTDFSIRAMIAGKKLWVADDVYIHHYGNQTFKTNRENHRILLLENRGILYEKWNITNNEEMKEVARRERPFDRARHYCPI